MCIGQRTQTLRLEHSKAEKRDQKNKSEHIETPSTTELNAFESEPLYKAFKKAAANILLPRVSLNSSMIKTIFCFIATTIWASAQESGPLQLSWPVETTVSSVA